MQSILTDRFWRIELFGGLRLLREATEITRFQTHKSAALLAYLALNSRNPVSREVLAEQFWPDTEPEAQRNSLRVALNSLRRQLEPPELAGGVVLAADRAAVRLTPESFHSDVSEFEAALKQEERLARANASRADRITALRAAAELYRGVLLPGWYEDWADSERNRLADLYANAMRRLTTLQLESQEYEAAVETARRSIAADPLREESHRLLIRVYAALGRQEDALRQFRELEAVLRDQLGTVPSRATRDLLGNLPAPVNTAPLIALPGKEPAPLPAEPAVPSPSPATEKISGYVPCPLTAIYGRDTEIEAIRQRITPSGSGSRLLTLTGPGGIGKTRLLLEVAAQLRPAFEGRVWFVSLAEATDTTTVAQTIASILRLPRLPDTDPTIQIRHELEGAPALLALDNMEQVAETGGACFVYELLTDLPELSCLVSSRQRLDVDGETEIAVGPLPTPAESVELERLIQYPSVRLFLERARTIRPDFAVTPRNAAAIAGLVARLEGIPLSVELAAAWVQVMTPAQMLERLSPIADEDTPAARFGLLRSDRRNVPARHRSLRVVLEESLRLLPEPARRRFGPLSVLRGSWELAAAEAICATSATCAPSENEEDAKIPVAQALCLLRQHSLLRDDETPNDDGVPRFRLLDTVREFAGTTLCESQRQAAVRAHARFFADRAEASSEIADADRDNLHAAISGALSLPEESRTALRLVVALWPYWYASGQSRTGLTFLQRALAAATPNPAMLPGFALLLTRAHFGAGRLQTVLGEMDEAAQHFQRCMHLCDDHRDILGEEWANRLAAAAALCHLLAQRGRDDADPGVRRTACVDLLARTRARTDAVSWEIAWALGALAMEEAAESPAAARAHFEESARIRTAAGDTWGAAEMWLQAADTCDGEKAARLRADATAAMDTFGSEWVGLADSFLNLGYIALIQGDSLAGRTLLADAQEAYAAANAPGGAALARQLYATLSHFSPL